MTAAIETVVMWNSADAKTFFVYGWNSPAGIVWKLEPVTPVRLKGRYDHKVQVQASVKVLDSDVLSELNKRFGY